MSARYDPVPRSEPSFPTEKGEKESLLPYYTDDGDDSPLPARGEGAFDESGTDLCVGRLSRTGRRFGFGSTHKHGRHPNLHHHRHDRRGSKFHAAWFRFGWIIKTFLVLSVLWIGSRSFFTRSHGCKAWGPSPFGHGIDRTFAQVRPRRLTRYKYYDRYKRKR